MVSKRRLLPHTWEITLLFEPGEALEGFAASIEHSFHCSAQRHNQLFRSRSASCLAETNEERQHQSTALSPRPSAPPAIQVSDSTPDHNITVPSEDFDLNRHLLDIATLSIPKVNIFALYRFEAALIMKTFCISAIRNFTRAQS